MQLCIGVPTICTTVDLNLISKPFMVLSIKLT